MLQFKISVSFFVFSIISSAIGSHFLELHLDDSQTKSFEIANKYLIYNSILIMILSLNVNKLMNINNIVKLYTIGTILFSFSIYLNIALSKFDINVLLFRLITPFGAILKIACLIALILFSKKRLINFLKSNFFCFNFVRL